MMIPSDQSILFDFIHSTTAPVTDYGLHMVLYQSATAYYVEPEGISLEIFERSLVSTDTLQTNTVQAWFKKFDAVCVGCSS